MEFKDKLKQTRIECGMSRRELAELTGLSVRTIQGYEIGARQPKIKTIEKLAKALDIEAMDLVVSTDKFEQLLGIYEPINNSYDLPKELRTLADKIENGKLFDLTAMDNRILRAILKLYHH